MKFKSIPIKGYNNIITSDNKPLFVHFVGNHFYEDRLEHWQFLEMMCKAHNEPFERIE